MKYAILSDVHANLEALEAVLEDAKDQNCTHHAFLGDYVGYCADPNACLEIVRALNAPCVQGNHDEYCSTDYPLAMFAYNMTKMVLWTRKQLAADDCQWLRKLPQVLQVEGFTIVHANLEDPSQWGYVFDELSAEASLAHQKTPVCFYGHTHVPLAIISDTEISIQSGSYAKFRVEAGKKYLVNPGSVGLSRDNNPAAAYLTYDLEKATIELRRVPYDFATTRNKIIAAGLGH